MGQRYIAVNTRKKEYIPLDFGGGPSLAGYSRMAETDDERSADDGDAPAP